ncbi:MAG: SGNH/GDSL hydrolase family protein [Gemmatimonadaceae bacterium]
MTGPGAGAAAGRDETGRARFLALGDSYTIGEGVAEGERWPVQLAALLRERGHAVAEPMIVARTGWTTSELAAAIERANPQGEFHLISLLIGVNNEYRGQPVDEYRTELRDLLRRAVAFAGGEPRRVLVLSIPDWGVTPFAAGRDRVEIGGEVDRFNAISRDETERVGARYVDVTPVSRAAAADSSLLAPDGLHPSGKMYAEWARLALKDAVAAIGEGTSAPAPGR